MRTLALVLVALLLTGCGVREESESGDARAELAASRAEGLKVLDAVAGKVAEVLDAEPSEVGSSWATHTDTMGEGHSCWLSASVRIDLPDDAAVPVYPRLLAARKRIDDEGTLGLDRVGQAASSWEIGDIRVQWAEPLGWESPMIEVSVTGPRVDVPESVLDDCREDR